MFIHEHYSDYTTPSPLVTATTGIINKRRRRRRRPSFSSFMCSHSHSHSHGKKKRKGVEQSRVSLGMGDEMERDN